MKTKTPMAKPCYNINAFVNPIADWIPGRPGGRVRQWDVPMHGHGPHSQTLNDNILLAQSLMCVFYCLCAFDRHAQAQTEEKYTSGIVKGWGPIICIIRPKNGPVYVMYRKPHNRRLLTKRQTLPNTFQRKKISALSYLMLGTSRPRRLGVSMATAWAQKLGE